jgi:hypothetical protein
MNYGTLAPVNAASNYLSGADAGRVIDASQPTGSRALSLLVLRGWLDRGQ